MEEKRILVVYYSRTGSTRKVAETIADLLECDIEQIVDKKKRGGPIGFLTGAKDAAMKKLTTIQGDEKDPSSYDLVIIGTPVWANTMSCAVRTYLSRYSDRLPQQVAFFLTTGGSGIESTFAGMEELCGKCPVAKLGLKAKEVRKGTHLDRTRQFVEEIRR